MKKNTIDLHTHSLLSGHAYSSLTENIEYAAKIGLQVYGISDHQPDNIGVGPHVYAFDNAVRIIPKEYENTKILIGAEVNITNNGINLNGINPKKMSYIIASIHSYDYLKEFSAEDNTNNYLKALDLDYVTFLGHIDNPKFKCDYETIIKTCKEKHKFIELNNASLKPLGSRIGARDIDKEILSYCVKYNLPIIMNSDAHIKYDIGNVDLCIDLLQEINFPEELVMNYNIKLFEQYFTYR